MVKVAFVGCGAMMRKHAGYLSNLEKVKLVGHCDLVRARAERAAHDFGGEAFSDNIEMYDRVRPDAVYVAVPPAAHGPIEVTAAERSIHLFIERPVALDRATAKRVSAAIRHAGVIASVGYCHRYSETVSLARTMLKGKAVSLVSGLCTAAFQEDGWRRKKSISGGHLIEYATPCIDLLRHWCGEVAEVYATSSNGAVARQGEDDIDDSSALALRMKNGAAAMIACSCVMHHSVCARLEVLTPDSTFLFDGASLRVTEPEKTTEYYPATDMYAEENRVFIEAVRSRTPGKIRSTYADAVKTLHVACAANESIQSGIPVKP